MITEITVPLELVAALCVAFAVMGAWAGRHYTLQRLLANGRPSSWAEQPSTNGPVIALANYRSVMPEASRAVVLGRVSEVNHGSDACAADTLRQVAEVMRASLRRQDRMAIRDDMTIALEIDGVDEGVARGIAQRLRGVLARMGFVHGRGKARLSLKFGIAAGPSGIAGDVLIQRAREALSRALREGEEHLVKASDIDEIRLLPPPDRAPLASAA